MLAQNSITESIVSAVRSHLGFEHYRIFYFGSRTKGKATVRSDFDVGIDAGQEIPLELMAKIKDKLDDIAILQKVDLVDFACVSQAFSRQARKTAKIIYEQ